MVGEETSPHMDALVAVILHLVVVAVVLVLVVGLAVAAEAVV